MRQPAAKFGDTIVATDTHIVMVPTAGGPVPVPLAHPFNGRIDANLSADVNIMGARAAIVGSTATNSQPHLPTSPGASFQKGPSNKGTIKQGSATVRINGKAVARNGDVAETCNDPQDAPVGKIVASGSVMVG